MRVTTDFESEHKKVREHFLEIPYLISAIKNIREVFPYFETIVLCVLSITSKLFYSCSEYFYLS